MTFEELGIKNDMPRGWISGKGQPLWHEKAYIMWVHMHDRVKNPENGMHYLYKDSKILEDFNFFSKYIEWLGSTSSFDEFCSTCHEICWSVDKDMKVKGNKNYYPEFMSLVPRDINSNDVFNRKGNPMKNSSTSNKSAKSRRKPIIGVSSKSILIFNSGKDATKFGFKSGSISNCCQGYTKTHGGYKWRFLCYKHNKTYRIKED